MNAKPLIRDYPPRDGKDYDCQCARCGSSCDWQRCEEWDCDDGFREDDWGDDVVAEIHLVACETCRGHGGWWYCMSGREWCEANPLPGREEIERGKIEWFSVERT